MPKKIRLSGIVGLEITADAVQTLLDEANYQELSVDLYTPGGMVYEGMEVFNIISRYPSKKEVIIGGLVASIGSVISAAFDTVKVTDSSTFMIHNTWDAIAGDAQEMRDAAEKLEKLNERIALILSKKSGKTIDEIKNMMNEETWLYGQEIVDAGFADELIETSDQVISQDKNTAVAIAKEKMKTTIAALYNKKEFNSGKGIENINDGDKSMDKKEMLKQLSTMFENGSLSISDIADSLPKISEKLIKKEHMDALEIVFALNEIGITDPVTAITDMQKQLEDNADAVRNALLSETFGVSQKDKDGIEKNLILNYVIDKTKDLAGKELNEKIESLKKDPIVLRLRSDAADPNSEQNIIGQIDKKDGQPEQKNGIKTVVL